MIPCGLCAYTHHCPFFVSYCLAARSDLTTNRAATNHVCICFWEEKCVLRGEKRGSACNDCDLFIVFGYVYTCIFSPNIWYLAVLGSQSRSNIIHIYIHTYDQSRPPCHATCDMRHLTCREEHVPIHVRHGSCTYWHQQLRPRCPKPASSVSSSHNHHPSTQQAIQSKFSTSRVSSLPPFQIYSLHAHESHDTR